MGGATNHPPGYEVGPEPEPTLNWRRLLHFWHRYTVWVPTYDIEGVEMRCCRFCPHKQLRLMEGGEE